MCYILGQISFLIEDDVIKFQSYLAKLVNIQYPGAGHVKISGYRINKKYVTEVYLSSKMGRKKDLDILFSWWGRVVASHYPSPLVLWASLERDGWGIRSGW